MIFDTHAHYTDARFDEDREELLAGMKARGVGEIVEVGASYSVYEGCGQSGRKSRQYLCSGGRTPGGHREPDTGRYAMAGRLDAQG